ncbi:MAG: HAMP domain-containing histidine kinase [Oligoflexia bacterium]|nr:HAMP domain-containing histidine kinase [Oligoflexia bacterium]
MEPGFGEGVAVGYVPSAELSPQDGTLFQAFQSNLLSLISHELRTPLMGVLNALTILEDLKAGKDGPVQSEEALAMARQNASRLQHSLSTLLDLASIESGTFHLRLREADLDKVVRHRAAAFLRKFEVQGNAIRVHEGAEAGAPVLGDPQRLRRAVDLVLEVALPRLDPGSVLEAQVNQSRAAFSFRLAEGKEAAWDEAWSQGLAGYEAGLSSPASAFAGVLQTEQAFLTRSEEGLGSEFLLIHQILRLHQGRLLHQRAGRSVSLILELPALASEEGLRSVLQSRAYQVSTELGSVALALIAVPAGLEPEVLGSEIKAKLFRSTDAAYPLPESSEVALVLDDCKPEDAPKLVERLARAVGRSLRSGIAHCPTDGLDPAALVELARTRMSP